MIENAPDALEAPPTTTGSSIRAEIASALAPLVDKVDKLAALPEKVDALAPLVDKVDKLTALPEKLDALAGRILALETTTGQLASDLGTVATLVTRLRHTLDYDVQREISDLRERVDLVTLAPEETSSSRGFENLPLEAYELTGWSVRGDDVRPVRPRRSRP